MLFIIYGKNEFPRKFLEETQIRYFFFDVHTRATIIFNFPSSESDMVISAQCVTAKKKKILNDRWKN